MYVYQFTSIGFDNHIKMYSLIDRHGVLLFADSVHIVVIMFLMVNENIPFDVVQ